MISETNHLYVAARGATFGTCHGVVAKSRSGWIIEDLGVLPNVFVVIIHDHRAPCFTVAKPLKRPGLRQLSDKATRKF